MLEEANFCGFGGGSPGDEPLLSFLSFSLLDEVLTPFLRFA